MRKFIAIIMSIILVFTLTGCNSKNQFKDSDNPAMDIIKNQLKETVDQIQREDAGIDDINPEEILPNKLPIYPGSDMTLTMPSYTEYNSRTWWFDSNATGNELVEYFKTELQKLGIEIDEENTYARTFQIMVSTKAKVVMVQNDESENIAGDVNPDTPGRSYFVIVDLDKWNY